MTPQFDVLREAIEGKRAHISESTTASGPELVAVFDLAGSVDRFFRAAMGIEGLEFLADVEEDYLDPDDEFFYENQGEVSDRTVPQSLYMVMTNAEAVNQLVRLFALWQSDPSIKFERGLNPLKEVFALLRAVRRWGPEDRVRETGLLQHWAEDLEIVGAQGTTRVEIELWYRTDAMVRAAALADVSRVVQREGGTVISTANQDAIAYHAVLADIPHHAVERVLADGIEAIELLKTEAIMFVSPSYPMAFPSSDPTPGPGLAFDDARPAGAPRVALLDGVPLANHQAVEGRVVIDDPDNRASLYAASQRRHGTGMVSLIAHGDLSDPGQAIRRPIYLRPILQPHAVFEGQEITSPDELLVDLVHRAFRRIFEGDGDHPPSAPSVRVVNLSVGDPTRGFVRRMSPLARLLDWLAHKYNIVIVVSAGNTGGLSIMAESLDDREAVQATALAGIHDRALHRRLLSPAEAMNALTVGALHLDNATEELPDTVIDAVPAGLPAGYSPVGFGYRRSVKPEILLPGGRQIFVRPPSGTTGPIELRTAETSVVGPGLAVAAPGLGGELDAVAYSHGTSNAAALATRALDGIFEMLEGAATDDSAFPVPDAQYHPVLAKTLLVHAAGWHDDKLRLRDLLGLSGRTLRRDLTQLLGYGSVRLERVGVADRTRAVLIGAGSIAKDHRHGFRFPLPRSLAATTEWRRLTVTLGWLSPVNARSQKYRMARLRFTPSAEQLGVAPVEADPNAVLKGTVQHQVLEGEEAVAFVEGTTLAIDVDCRVDTGTLSEPVRYAIAASVEVSPALGVDLYDEVRAALRAQIQEEARERVATRSR